MILKEVKQIVNYKPMTSAKHIKLRVNDREIASPVEVANAINTYFSSIGNNPNEINKHCRKISYGIFT